MHRVQAQILVDEAKRPIAVRIPYGDWLEIEAQLDRADSPGADLADLVPYEGTLSLSEDPLTYQTRMRGEWS